MGGHDLKVNAIVNCWKQLARSFVLLANSFVLMAHYGTLVGGCVSRSVRCFVEVVRWTSLLSRCTVSAFESLHRHLYRWIGRRAGALMDRTPSSDMESD